MDFRSSLIVSGISALIFVGLYYGYRFARIGNALLAAEWAVLGFSASNFMLWFLMGSMTPFWIMTVCDSFSRSIGIPVIGALGLAKVTHGLDFSALTKWGLFVGGFLLAIFLVNYAPLQPYLPTAYLILGLPWSAFLLYFAYRLFAAGARLHAAAVVVAAAATFVVATLEGIIAIPGDETNLFLNFFFIAHWVWALSFAEIFYAYRVLERRGAERSGAFVPALD